MRRCDRFGTSQDLSAKSCECYGTSVWRMEGHVGCHRGVGYGVGCALVPHYMMVCGVQLT